MMVRNFELDRLEAKRDKVRKEVKELTKSKCYEKHYDRIKALHGLDTYLSYVIDRLTTEMATVHDKDNLV